MDKRVRFMELRHIKRSVETLHTKLKEGYAVEGDELINVINAMLSFLHDVISSAESHNVSLDGKKVWS